MPRRPLAPLAVLTVLALAAGCAGGEQSVLSPVGTRAQGSDANWQLMLVLGSATWIFVALAVGAALVGGRRRRRAAGTDEPAQQGTPGRARGLTVAVALAGAVVPAVVIIVVTVHSVLVLEDIDPRAAGDGVVVEVVGNQFWWEVRYPEEGVVTANEIHIPTGERVQVLVSSDDVVHSLWVPALSGKIDLVPGRTNTIWFETDTPGVYWGQCAEFCGIQHARMRLVVVAHERADYEEWVERQAAPAVEPVNGPPGADDEPLVEADADDADAVALGREVFMTSSCAECHSIQGTPADGDLGPDLTHFGSRLTIGAGIVPNERGWLGGWIANSQTIKPGNLMPPQPLEPDELRALIAYLESLE